MSKKINKARLFRNIILIVLLLGSVGLYLSNKYVKTKGFDNIGDFVSNYQTNKNLSDGVEAEVMQLLLSDNDYQFLKDKRQESLDRGIQINIGDNYVDCKLCYKGDTVKGEMRLKGHMTDHLEGDKWSFRVKTKDEVMGMYRFSLQNPATRNYAYEWIYHELLAHEGVIHLKYDFIRLKLNDNDLGIYAIEEHFGQHILRDNGRPPGAILRWNPELYWEHRVDEFTDIYLDEEYSAYSSSFPEAYDKGVVKRDFVLIETYQKGAQLLEAFRRGSKTASEVFDVDKMATFHAVIDLVGGYHSLDWSDVKFYYNSETKRIEPVGYESFSVRETVKIAGQRTPEDYESVGFDYHDKLFADPIFYAAYIHNLERVCDEAYFKSFTDKIEDQLNLKRGILAEEFAYIKFSFQPYYDNIELIRHNLELPKPLHAFLEESTDSTVTISVAPVSDFPIEIIALSVNDKRTYVLDSATVLPPKARNTFAHYSKLVFKYDGKKLKDLKLVAKIPGGSTEFKIEVADFSMKLDEQIELALLENTSTDSLLTWLNDSVAIFRNEQTMITDVIAIPKGKSLIVSSGQKLNFVNQGRIIVEGELRLLGNDFEEVFITSNDPHNSYPNVSIINGELIAVHVQFAEMQASFLQMQGGSARFEQCFVADASQNSFLTAKRANITFLNCASGNMKCLGEFDRCTVKLKLFNAQNGDTFIVDKGSDIEMHQSMIAGYQSVAKLNHLSDFSTWSSKFKANNLICELDNISSFKTYSCSILSGDLGVDIKDITRPDGATSSYLFYKTPIDNLTKEVSRANG